MDGEAYEVTVTRGRKAVIKVRDVGPSILFPLRRAGSMWRLLLTKKGNPSTP